MRKTRSALLERIAKGEWGDEVEAELKAGIEEFKKA